MEDKKHNDASDFYGKGQNLEPSPTEIIPSKAYITAIAIGHFKVISLLAELSGPPQGHRRVRH